MLLTEERLKVLENLAVQYANLKNLDKDEYIEGLFNPDTVGDSDIDNLIEIMIRYHKEWLRKNNGE